MRGCGQVQVVFLPGDLDAQNPVMPLVFSRCGCVCTRYVAHRSLFGTPDGCCRCCVLPLGVTARGPRKPSLFTSDSQAHVFKAQLWWLGRLYARPCTFATSLLRCQVSSV